MESPTMKESWGKRTANQGTTASCIRTDNINKSCASLQCPHLVNALDGYLSFKRKLLEAMQQCDPLAILQLGIFEEFEQILNYPYLPSNKATLEQSDHSIHKRNINMEKYEISDFQTILQTYDMSQSVQVTQLQRRSRSCSPKQKRKPLNLRETQLKNVEFVLWANAMREITNSHQDMNCNSPSLTLEAIKINRMKADNEELMQTIKEKENQNQRLRNKLAELQRSHQHKKENSQISTQNDDHRLEYLLKQKQLNKKLQEAKEEIARLRVSLDKNTEHHSTPQIFKQIHEEIASDSLSILRQKVENEGRVKRALQLLWGNELESKCSLQQGEE